MIQGVLNTTACVRFSAEEPAVSACALYSVFYLQHEQDVGVVFARKHIMFIACCFAALEHSLTSSGLA